MLCFTSDHGDMLGSHGEFLKQRPWEESIKVPFILRYPRGVPAGRRRDWLVSSIDIFPTLLGLAGIAVPGSAEGMDLAHLFREDAGPERDAAFLFNVSHGNAPAVGDWRGIRTKRWVYAYHAGGDWILYDLADDPFQLRNLVDDPACVAQKEALRAQLDEMRASLSEDLELSTVNRKG